ncbi:uncharacterized protein ARMOST_20949 [Armillaria ostoyae]|uniref:Uncharacterized protein n=1 Tax=Armillaria ostoyae TaxID=47428 RepID=A0A284S8R8_ARMOS|nr:uncharacterized protein ARMOST_20949 [Armillaria ostoyae]
MSTGGVCLDHVREDLLFERMERLANGRPDQKPPPLSIVEEVFPGLFKTVASKEGSTFLVYMISEDISGSTVFEKWRANTASVYMSATALKVVHGIMETVSLPLLKSLLPVPMFEFLTVAWEHNGSSPLSDAANWLEHVHWLVFGLSEVHRHIAEGLCPSLVTTMLVERHCARKGNRKVEGVLYAGIDVSTWVLYPEPMPFTVRNVLVFQFRD